MNALSNIAVINAEYRDFLIEHGVVDKVNSILNKKCVSGNVYQAGIFLISNLFAIEPIPLLKLKPLVTHLMNTLWLTNEVILADALYSLDKIISNGIQLSDELVQRIILNVKNRNIEVSYLALKVLESIRQDLIVKCGGLTALKNILEAPKNPHKRQSLAIVLKLVKNKCMVSKLIEEKIHLTMLKLIEKEDISIMKTIACTYYKFIEGADINSIKILLNDGAMAKYAELLNVSDMQVRYTVLSGIKLLLHTLSGQTLKHHLLLLLQERVSDRLEEICDDKNEVNAELAAQILNEVEHTTIELITM